MEMQICPPILISNLYTSDVACPPSGSSLLSSAAGPHAKQHSGLVLVVVVVVVFVVDIVVLVVLGNLALVVERLGWPPTWLAYLPSQVEFNKLDDRRQRST